MTSAGPNQAQIQTVFQHLMAKHGVILLRRTVSMKGMLFMAPSGVVVHRGVHVEWTREKTPHTTQAIEAAEDAFFRELYFTLSPMGIARVEWGDDAKIGMVKDNTNDKGYSFKMLNMQFLPPTTPTL